MCIFPSVFEREHSPVSQPPAPEGSLPTMASTLDSFRVGAIGGTCCLPLGPTERRTVRPTVPTHGARVDVAIFDKPGELKSVNTQKSPSNPCVGRNVSRVLNLPASDGALGADIGVSVIPRRHRYRAPELLPPVRQPVSGHDA